MSRKQQLILGLGLVAYAVVLRLLPHPANFAPMTAVAIFSGARFSRREAILTALAAGVISDSLVGFYTFGVMATVWLSYMLIALASHRWLRRPALVRGGLFTLAGSSFFFLTSNFAVWIWGGIYPHTLSGLSSCFALALPFFRNSLLGDLTYTGLLFGLFAAAVSAAHGLRPSHQSRQAS